MPVVITGSGVLSVLGIGSRPVFENLLAAPAEHPAEVPGFKAAEFLGPRGLRHFDRTALLLASAAKLALEESGLSAETYGADGLGVVVGSTHGSIQAIAEFDQEAVREGPKYVNPQQFPNTVISAPAGRIAVLFGATGLNTTIATGNTSALEALDYAAGVLEAGSARALLCGAGLGNSREIAEGYGRDGRLVPANDGCVPFEAGRRGAALAEGASAFVLETAGSAAARGVRPLAVVAGVGRAFTQEPDGLERAMRATLAQAGLTPAHVGCVVASACGSPAGDLEEGRAILALLGAVPVTAPKSAIGECLEASGAIAVAIALRILHEGVIPPVARSVDLDPELSALNLVRGGPLRRTVEHVLIPARDPEGHCAALVLSKPA